MIYAMGHEGVRRPMLFRVRRKDGSYFIAEITANSQMQDGQVGGLIAYLRRWDERQLMDDVLQSLASGDDIENVLELLIQVMRAEILEADGMVLWEAVDGRFSREVRSPCLPAALLEPSSSGNAPWDTSKATGEVLAVLGHTSARGRELPLPPGSVSNDQGSAGRT